MHGRTRFRIFQTAGGYDLYYTEYESWTARRVLIDVKMEEIEDYIADHYSGTSR